MGAILAFFKLFELGQSVLDVAKWKAHQVNANTLSLFAVALLNFLPLVGVHVPASVNVDSINSFFAWALPIINSVLTIVTSDKLGVMPSSVSDARTTLFPGIIAATNISAANDSAPDQSAGLSQAASVVASLPAGRVGDTVQAAPWPINDSRG